MGVSETLKALADPQRQQILQLLRGGKLSAGEIAGHFQVTGAAISYHLNILKKAGLVFETKYKNYIYYELNLSVFEGLVLWINELKGGEPNDPENP